MIFSSQSMQEILPQLQKILETEETLRFTVINPDNSDGHAGHKMTIENITYIYRGYKAWVDLAELLKCKMTTPKVLNDTEVELTFVKLKTDSFHSDAKDSEKYGSNSQFAKYKRWKNLHFSTTIMKH